MRTPLLVALATVLLAVAVGCSQTQTVPSAQPMPAGKSFSGVWYSPQFEHMHLRQSGDQVSGIFTHDTGGKIEGTVNGNTLVFDWVEPGNKEQARRTMKGKGYLQLVAGDKTRLVGEWGYDDQRTGGGPWKAEYVRELEPDDPLTLDEWQDQRN